MRERIDTIKKKMHQEKLDAYLLQTRENKFYLSGLDHQTSDDHSISLMLITKDKSYFLIGKMEAAPAAKVATECEIVSVDKGDTAGSLIGTIAKDIGGIKRIGYEYFALKHMYVKSIREFIPDVEFIPSEIAENLRQIKTVDEMERISRAMEIADSAISEIKPLLTKGKTENEIAWALELFVRSEFGVKELAFPTIVASGVNSSSPHHVPTDKLIEKGDFVTIDFGVRNDGYCSDITRTFVIGQASDKQKNIYNTVLESLQKATAASMPGITGKELDEVARSYIAERGYGEYFIHGLGHSLGVEVHEPPFISASGDTSILPGVVFTIEPGIYIPEFCGVRIEDSVLMTDDGVKVLTKSPRELIELEISD